MLFLPFLRLLFFFFVKFLCLQLQANASGNVSDHLSLLKFKESITSDPDGIFNSWNDSVPFCNWVGITCNPRHGRVISIVLPQQDLVGSISPYIGNLSFLQVIDLRNNGFRGVIPHEVGRLFRLQRFNFENNAIAGEIPASIANCSELRSITLSYNFIVGRIPAEIGSNLQKLEQLRLGRNNLTGQIPSLGNCSAIRVFSVAYNNMDGNIPEDLGRKTNLTFFAVGVNNFSGVIPSSIYNISTLANFSVGSNRLHGTLPDDLCLTLPNLYYFGIGGNMFTGKIPKSIANCSQMNTFDISFNSFEGQVPSDFGKLKILSVFNLGRNNLGSYSEDDFGFIKSLRNCTGLTVFAIDENRFGGILPDSVANLSTQLLYFYIPGNRFSGKFPDGLDNLVNLFSLDIGANLFSGSIPSYFGNLKNLQLLDIGENSFSGEIPVSLENLTQLATFSAPGNRLAGNIPSSVGNCQMLSVLDLSRNNLTGEIPLQVFLLPSLQKTLNLSRNKLVGVLPPEIGKLTELNNLDVSENNFTGKIPPQIGDCQHLELLNLRGNSFRGTIPSTLVSLKALQDLDLSRNDLSGPIPTNLQNLTLLKYLNLSFNHLEGEVPSEGVFSNASVVSVQGNSKLCGGISEFRLPKCPSYQKVKSSDSKLVVIVICLAVSIVLLIALVYLNRGRSSKKKSMDTELIGENLIKVSYGDLYGATSGFSPDNLIGRGGFSSVYRGSLVQFGKPVAVKVLNLDKKGATKSFKAECRALRNIRHRNLVKVLTYCSSIDYKGNDFKALVYEFMENGSLEKWLHPTSDGSSNLSILQRMNIAIDAASALHYLHDLCEIPTVHCDLKPSNILLDDDMVAHLSDFGLARLFSTENNPPESLSSTIEDKGTVGYAAPEYGTAAAASKEGDVYSYGILLLEMFSGRRPTDEMFNENLNLHGFVEAALPTRILQIIDPSLLAVAAERNNENEIMEEDMNNENHIQMSSNMQKCLLSVLEIGLSCSMESPGDRMKMADVTRKLHLIRNDLVGTSHHNGRGRRLQNN